MGLKPVFNIPLGGGVEVHSHPEVTDNASSIAANTSNIGYILSGDTVFTGDKEINGSVTVRGSFYAVSATIITTEELVLSSNFIDLNNNFGSGAPTEDAGIRVIRGDEASAEIRWDETNNYWTLGVVGSMDRVILSGDLLTQLANYIPLVGTDNLQGSIVPSTSGLNLGSHDDPFGFVHAEAIDLHTLSAPEYHEGTLFYDSDDKTLSLYPEISAVTLQVGQEEWIRAKNQSGAQIDNGTIVYLSGATGANPLLGLASAVDETRSATTIGVATHDIPDNEVGYITTFGKVRGLNTDSYVEGEALYLSTTPGEFTNIKPDAPNHTVWMGYCLRSHPNAGEILVSIKNGFELYELHDVSDQVSGAVEGDVINWSDSLSAWVNSTRLTDTETNVSSLSAQNVLWVTQASHGFTAGNAIYNNAGTWTKAQSDDADTLGVSIVTEVLDANTFALMGAGYASLSAHGFAQGQYLFVSPTLSGELTATAPVGLTEYANPIAYAVDADTLFVHPWRPVQALTRSNDMRTVSVSADYTVLDTDEAIEAWALAGTVNITVPTPSDVYDGFAVTVKKFDTSSNPVIIKSGSGMIDDVSGSIGKQLVAPNTAMTVVCEGNKYNAYMNYIDLGQNQTFGGNVTVSGNVIGGTEPAASNHLTTKNYVDNYDAYLSGQINVNASNIAANDADIDFLSGAVLWELNGTNIQPKDITQGLSIPSISGSTSGTILTTDQNGVFQSSTMSITDGVSGGSLINVIEHSTDPLSADLVVGDLWVVDSPATSGKLLKYWDGTSKYSVELSKE
jgi:hypothetical protein